MITNVENLGKTKGSGHVLVVNRKAAKHPTPEQINATSFSSTCLSSVGF